LNKLVPKKKKETQTEKRVWGRTLLTCAKALWEGEKPYTTLISINPEVGQGAEQ